MRYTLGLNIGEASVGWAVVNEDENRIEALNAKLFKKGENEKGKTFAQIRREAKGKRKTIRRKAFRIKRIREYFIETGLLTQDDISENNLNLLHNDPWRLRAEGLERELSNKELAAILIHFAKHRGFKSNRKSEIAAVKEEKEEGKMQKSDKKDDTKKILSNILSNHEKLERFKNEKGYRTAGEMFYKETLIAKENGQLFNIRNKDRSYINSIGRKDLEDELAILFEAQKKFGNKFITEEFKNRYLQLFNSQRPVATDNDIEKMVGKCTFEKDEMRAPKHCYSAERFVLFENLNKLRLIEYGEKTPLNKEQRDFLIEKAYTNVKITYGQIRKWLKLNENIKFSLVHYDYKKTIEKSEKNAVFATLSGYHDIKNAVLKIGESYWQRIKSDIPLMDTIAYALTFKKTDYDIVNYLHENCNLPEEIIQSVLTVNFTKVSHLSVKAIKKILPYIEEGYIYSEDCAKAGYVHYNPNAGNKKYNKLPCIPVDEIKNPIVCRALTQARKVINSIIEEYGAPYRINVELSRELTKSFEERGEIVKKQKKNKDNKDKLFREFEELFDKKPNSDELEKYRLYKEQDGISLYSGQPINLNMLFSPGYAQVDHILAMSRSFNNRYMNKAVVLTADNHNKGNKTPYEFFGSDAERWNRFEELVKSSNGIPYAKKDNLLNKHFKGKGTDFLSRSINDTGYIRRYIYNFIKDNLMFSDSSNSEKVRAISGEATSYLKYRWGLSKYRNSIMRHALDAAVTAVSNRNFINKINKYHKACELYNIRIQDHYIDPETGELVKDQYRNIDKTYFPEPWKGFAQDLRKRITSEDGSILNHFKKEDIKTIVVRTPERKAKKTINDESIRSNHLNEGYSTYKTKLDKINLQKLENEFNKESDMKLYNVLKERLEEFNDDPKKAFEEPVYKPKKDGTLGPIVRSINLTTIQKSGVLLNKGRGVADNANGSIVRTDIFEKDGEYYCMPVYSYDIYREILPNEVFARKSWIKIDETFKFCFSLYPRDLIKVKYQNKLDVFSYYRGFDRATGRLSGYDVLGNEVRFSLKKGVESAEKWSVDNLGRLSRVKKEKRNGMA